MGNYTIFGRFENPWTGRQARNLTTNVPRILDLKSPSEQIFSKNCRWVPPDRFQVIPVWLSTGNSLSHFVVRQQDRTEPSFKLFKLPTFTAVSYVEGDVRGVRTQQNRTDIRVNTVHCGNNIKKPQTAEKLPENF